MNISLVVPAYNEEENIQSLIENIEQSVNLEHELIIVNDHSTDRTVDIVTRLMGVFQNLKLVSNLGERGFAHALKTGFMQAKNPYLIPVMGDSCDDLNTIVSMHEVAEKGYDVVCGSRYMKGGKRAGGPRIKALLSSSAGISLHWILGIPTHDVANAFKLYSKKMIEALPLESPGFEISIEITLRAFFAGYKITEVATTWKERTKGKSSFKVLRLLPRYLKWYFWAVGKKISNYAEKCGKTKKP